MEGSRLSFAGLVLTIGLCLLAFGQPAFAEGVSDVRTASSSGSYADQVKTIPITRKPGQKTRSVLSLGPTRLGELPVGGAIEGASDVELTICIRPNPNHPGRGQPCVGRYYDFNPRFTARLVVSRSARSASTHSLPVGPPKRFTCTEKAGRRTRHCVQQLGFSTARIDERVKSFCTSCHLNLLVTAYHPQARKGQRVVVGTSDDRKRIRQGRSQLTAIVYPSEAAQRPRRSSLSRRPLVARPPVAAHGQSFRERVVYSQRIEDAKRGDQLVVEARPTVANGHLPYPTRAHYWIVASKHRRGTEQTKRLVEQPGDVAVANGFTCTRVRSAHQSPCPAIKTGVISVDRPGTFFVNLVIGQDARGVAPQYRKWRRSHRTRMLRSGFMRVRSFRGTMGCPTCRIHRGFFAFPSARPPADPRLPRLVEEIQGLGFPTGGYRCERKLNVPLACIWRGRGRLGDLPRFECKGRARFKGGRWHLRGCPPVGIGPLLRR